MLRLSEIRQVTLVKNHDSKPPAAREVIKGVPWFSALEPVVLERLAAMSRLKLLRPGEILSRRGEPQTLLSIVQSGGLEISIQGRDGKRHVIRHLHEREVFGLIPVLDGNGGVHDASAHGVTEILQIPRDVLVSEVETHPALAMSLMMLMCKRFRQLYELFAVQHLLSLNARVAHLLTSLASIEPQSEPRPGEEIEVHLTQRDLSDMLGVSRQSLNVELKKLEQRGLIRLAHARIIVADPVGLERYATGLI